MFKIKSVSVKDASNTPSIVEFTDGLNIIYGPSNCGKTFILDCIDYAMGSSQFNNDDTAGIVEVKIEIATPEGDIALTRPMGGDIVNVDSHRDDIQNGEYSVSEKKSMPSLNSV
jgi:recombinational DNA repair ATPase RecF